MKIKISNDNINMNKADLKKLSKSELIKLLLKQSKDVESNVQENIKRRKPMPTPRKSVKDMVKRYEENIILPPTQFRDNYKPVPTPRTIILPPTQFRDNYKPVPAPCCQKTGSDTKNHNKANRQSFKRFCQIL